ncbi:MAG: GNAT superfamily N-acetyltransferase [Bacteroidia bacterium]|jgi:GNAT superfamily N-acetyltransferase
MTLQNQPNITIRQGTKNDLPAAMELIKELAVFEREPEAVTNTLENMERDGFGPNKVFDFYVASIDEVIVGISVFYFRYSTWKGRCLYLEDLVVTEKHRGSGIGKLLFEQTIAFAKETKCKIMVWQVLDWNEPAIQFYERYGATFHEEWLNCIIEV